MRGLVAVDLRSLAALRIGLGLVLLADLAGRSADLVAHYTDAGVMPRAEVARWLGPAARASLHMLGDGVGFAVAHFALAGLAAVAFTLGFRTRLAAVVSWYLLLSLHVRNPAVLHGGDNLLRVLLFWSMFLPLGGRFSLDARRPAPAATEVVSIWGLALRLQLCLAYWATAALKWYPPWLGERTAVGLAVSIDQFATRWGLVLKEHPDLLALATPAVMALEVLGPLAVWSPWRTPQVRVVVVSLFIGFHLLGLAPAMVLGNFPWVAAVAWTVFLPGWFWDRLMERPWAERLRRGAQRAAPDGQAAAPAAAAVAPPGARGRLADAACALLLAYVVALNLQNVVRDRLELPPTSGPGPAALVGLHQSWRMFTPAPSTQDGWYQMVGILEDGRVWEVWRDEPPSAEKPPLVSASLGNHRWVKYLTQIRTARRRGYLPLFCRYLCRRWNAGHEGAERIRAVRVVFYLEETLAPGREAPPQTFILWQESCPAGPRPGE